MQVLVPFAEPGEQLSLFRNYPLSALGHEEDPKVIANLFARVLPLHGICWWLTLLRRLPLEIITDYR